MLGKNVTLFRKMAFGTTWKNTNCFVGNGVIRQIMNQKNNYYVCPETKKPLRIEASTIKEGEIISGILWGPGNRSYPIEMGIPDLTFPPLNNIQAAQRDYYDREAETYDDFAHLTFKIQNVDEAETRAMFVDLLNISPSSRVLEIACGTGKDTLNIAARLGAQGGLSLLDISRKMLLKCREKLQSMHSRIDMALGNACALPYPDKSFDAVLSFGGINEFSDIKSALREIVRVTKSGGRIVVGDESMPPWLYDTEFAKVLMDNNHLFKRPVPLADLPIEARDTTVRWIIGGVYYLIDFTVGEGEPSAAFDLEIPGRRGGTLRNRYYGKLEGVKPETKKMALSAAERTGKSMHDWLDEVVRKAASDDLEK
jgi:ubiquinone/menaquinone biosynthesis C-methylase UbiE